MKKGTQVVSMNKRGYEKNPEERSSNRVHIYKYSHTPKLISICAKLTYLYVYIILLVGKYQEQIYKIYKTNCELFTNKY